MDNPVLENKRMLEEMHARVFKIYKRLPGERKKEAQRLIDKWHEGRLGYKQLLEELEKLAAKNGKDG